MTGGIATSSILGALSRPFSFDLVAHITKLSYLIGDNGEAGVAWPK